MIAVLIVGIMAAVAVPAYADALMRFRVDLAARRVAADLATAQARAKATSGPVTVAFDMPAGQYSISGMDDPDHPGTTYAVRLSASPYVVTINTVDFAGKTSLRYTGYGLPDSAGTLVFQCGRHASTVSVDPNTGSVSIQSSSP